MITCSTFYDLLIKNDIDFFTGVPDSLLKSICAYISDHAAKDRHIIAANEGNAIALAAGYHLATGKIGLVYMQNSGLGNTVNPLTSLTDKEVYSLPVLLLIGWRGEPGKKDEPQHIKQGRITTHMLDTLEIPFELLPKTPDQAEKILDTALTYIRDQCAPFALVVRKETFDNYVLQNTTPDPFELSREQLIKMIVSYLSPEDIVVSTTGMISRELFEVRERLQQGHARDFLTVGSMGHSSQIALTISLAKPDRQVYCLDGDGAVIMHMGTLAIIGDAAPANYKHIVINNGAHDSVGGQPTVGLQINIPAIAKSCGYKEVFQASTAKEVAEKLDALRTTPGPALIEVRVNKGARKNLGRPTSSPIENKLNFQKFIR